MTHSPTASYHIPAPQPIPQQLHQPEAIHVPQCHRQHKYPNGHLDPNINSNLPREHRNTRDCGLKQKKNKTKQKKQKSGNRNMTTFF